MTRSLSLILLGILVTTAAPSWAADRQSFGGPGGSPLDQLIGQIVKKVQEHKKKKTPAPAPTPAPPPAKPAVQGFDLEIVSARAVARIRRIGDTDQHYAAIEWAIRNAGNQTYPGGGYAVAGPVGKKQSFNTLPPLGPGQVIIAPGDWDFPTPQAAHYVNFNFQVWLPVEGDLNPGNNSLRVPTKPKVLDSKTVKNGSIKVLGKTPAKPGPILKP
jgi:hypothetical protein